MGLIGGLLLLAGLGFLGMGVFTIAIGLWHLEGATILEGFVIAVIGLVLGTIASIILE